MKLTRNIQQNILTVENLGILQQNWLGFCSPTWENQEKVHLSHLRLYMHNFYTVLKALDTMSSMSSLNYRYSHLVLLDLVKFISLHTSIEDVDKLEDYKKTIKK